MSDAPAPCPSPATEDDPNRLGRLVLLAFVVEVGLAFIGANIWSDKAATLFVGGLIGFFLGILGLILVAVLTRPLANVSPQG